MKRLREGASKTFDVVVVYIMGSEPEWSNPLNINLTKIRSEQGENLRNAIRYTQLFNALWTISNLYINSGIVHFGLEPFNLHTRSVLFMYSINVYSTHNYIHVYALWDVHNI